MFKKTACRRSLYFQINIEEKNKLNTCKKKKKKSVSNIKIFLLSCQSKKRHHFAAVTHFLGGKFL